jgi:hypothetical protein
VCSVDTDVVVLAVALIEEIQAPELKLWIAFGTGKDLRYIAAHEICAALGPRKSLCLPMFHAFTGCDTVSQFAQIGKKAAWKIWEIHDEEITDALFSLHNAPTVIPAEVEATLEKFVIWFYDRTSTSTSINEVRKILFSRKGKEMSMLPPTQAALKQHIRRATLQGGHYWGNLTTAVRSLPSPADWGWTSPESWKPLWSDLPQASASCPELLKCRCRSRCTECCCVMEQLKCTIFCTCKGECANV